EGTEVGAPVRLGPHVRLKTVLVEKFGSEINAVDGNAVTEVRAPQHPLRGDRDIAFRNAADSADLFDDAGEHRASGVSVIVTLSARSRQSPAVPSRKRSEA